MSSRILKILKKKIPEKYPNLSWNRLNRVSVPFARRNDNMTHIYFHHNNIRSLPSNLIYGSRKLRSADFEFNKLQAVRYVKPEKRVKPKNMHTIDLQRNWRVGRYLNTVGRNEYIKYTVDSPIW